MSSSSLVELEVSDSHMLATLVRRRGQIKASLTRINTFVEKFKLSPDYAAEASSRLVTLPSIMSNFDDVQSRIEELDLDHDDDHLINRDDFETRYHHIAGQLSKWIETSSFATNVSKDAPNTSLQQTESILSHVSPVSYTRSSLPALPLELFSGNLANWQRFYNCFMSRMICHYLSRINFIIFDHVYMIHH
jgi:hypothetical protein